MKSRTGGKERKATVPLCYSRVLNLTIGIVLLEDNPEFTIACFTGYYKNGHHDLARFMHRN